MGCTATKEKDGQHRSKCHTLLREVTEWFLQKGSGGYKAKVALPIQTEAFLFLPMSKSLKCRMETGLIQPCDKENPLCSCL